MSNKIRSYIRILSIFGIILSLYILYEQFAQPTFQPCNVNALVNCNAIVSGPVAKTLGIPTPLYGLIGYVFIFLAAHFKKARTTFLITVGGMLFCLYIAYIELFQLRVICPLCILCQGTMLSVFVLSLLTLRKKSV